MLEAVEYICVLDNVVVYASWSNARTDDSGEAFCISIFSKCVLFAFLDRFHFPVIGHDSEDTVLEESGFFQLQIEIIEAFVCVSKCCFFGLAVRSIVRFVKRYAL